MGKKKIRKGALIRAPTKEKTMLREITKEEMFTKEADKILVIRGGTIVPLMELLEGARFLVEEAKTDPEPEEKKEKKSQRGGSRKSMEDEILTAWKGGERSIKEIMAITGASYQTVRKYIPATERG